MKENNWEPEADEIAESSKEFFDSMAFMDDQITEFKMSKNSRNRKLTELRRRSEERRDSKEIAHLFDYDYEDGADKLQ